MLIFELSSHVLEIPNNGYTTLSQILLAVQNSVKSFVSGLVDIGKQRKGIFDHLACPIDRRGIMYALYVP